MDGPTRQPGPGKTGTETPTGGAAGWNAEGLMYDMKGSLPSRP
jgi:hypothetical protein